MDPASLVVAEQTVSTTVEGAAIAGYGLAQSTQPLNATFTRITSEAFLPRSSHTISVVAGKAYIYGGEESPGQYDYLPAKNLLSLGCETSNHLHWRTQHAITDSRSLADVGDYFRLFSG